MRDVDAYWFEGRTVMSLHLEDGREFTMVNVEPLVVQALNKRQSTGLRGGFILEDERLSIFDALTLSENVIKALKESVDSVVVADLNRRHGTYIAYLRLRVGDAVIEKPMIPSHAIYLAIIAGKPIYVNENLIEENRDFGEP
ncbi:MAG: bifunctional nuclease family protein [Thermoprotei archaeon]